jgi:hypothetical protein
LNTDFGFNVKLVLMRNNCAAMPSCRHENGYILTGACAISLCSGKVAISISELYQIDICHYIQASQFWHVPCS